MNKKINVLIVSMLSVASCGSALAYDAKDDAEVVKERQGEEYARQGIHAGSFIVLPKMDMTNEYNTNIYYQDKSAAQTATQHGVVDSYVAHFKPGVDFRSNWNRHALNLSFDSDITEYATTPANNNYQDLHTRLDGRFDVARDSHLDGGFAYNSVHEQRGSPDQRSANGPTFYDTKIIDGFYTHKFNRVSVKGGVDTIRYDYQDVQNLQNVPLLMSTRSHWEYMPSIRLAYEIQPEYEAFVKFTYKEADYDSLTRSSGLGTAYNRNSTGYNALGGLAFDLTDLLTGDMSVGYLHRDYTDVRLKSISGVNGFVNLKWRPTALTTVNGKISHDILETTQQGVAGVLATTLSLGAEHELMRNVILSAGGAFSNYDYQGFVPSTVNNFNRNDKMYGGSVAAKYLLNRNLSTDLAYNYQNRDANYLFSNYEVHQIMLNLRGQF